MRSLKHTRGFTAIELFILIILVFIVTGLMWGIIALFMGNYWYDETGILRKLKIDHPNVTEIVDTQRNVFSDSRIRVIENGQTVIYELDSDILLNYELEKEKP